MRAQFWVGAVLFGVAYGAFGLDVSSMIVCAAGSGKVQFWFSVGGLVAGEQLYKRVIAPLLRAREPDL